MPALPPSRETPEPAGFPQCKRCPYRETGTSAICYGCASQTLPQLCGPTCAVCGQMEEFGGCGNAICSWNPRGFGKVHVIAMHQGALRSKISAFKHDGMTGWAIIFGRIIVGYLGAHADELRGYDLITPNPTFPAPGKVRHTELTITQAARHDDGPLSPEWPFDAEPWVMRKSAATPKSTSGKWVHKHEAARLHAEAIEVDASAIAGKRILLYDDVLTTASQFHHVGMLLLNAGAAHVDGLVLARRGWT